MSEKFFYMFINLAKKIIYKRENQVEKRLKTVAKYGYGDILEIGTTEFPNIYLPNNVIAFDIIMPSTTLPVNYKKFVNGSATELSKYFGEESFDTIIATEVIEHIPNHCDFLIENLKCLKKGGRLIMTSPNPYHVFTLLGNLFFPKGFSQNCEWKGKSSVEGPYYGHIHLHIPRILNMVAKLCGFEVEVVKYFWGFGRFFSGTILYIYRKPEY